MAKQVVCVDGKYFTAYVNKDGKLITRPITNTEKVDAVTLDNACSSPLVASMAQNICDKLSHDISMLSMEAMGIDTRWGRIEVKSGYSGIAEVVQDKAREIVKDAVTRFDELISDDDVKKLYDNMKKKLLSNITERLNETYSWDVREKLVNQLQARVISEVMDDLRVTRLKDEIREIVIQQFVDCDVSKLKTEDE